MFTNWQVFSMLINNHNRIKSTRNNTPQWRLACLKMSHFPVQNCYVVTTVQIVVRVQLTYLNVWWITCVVLLIFWSHIDKRKKRPFVAYNKLVLWSNIKLLCTENIMHKGKQSLKYCEGRVGPSINTCDSPPLNTTVFSTRGYLLENNK